MSYPSIAVLLLATVSSHALTQAVTPPTGGPYMLTKQVIAAGAARASGGAFVLTGTIAQSSAASANAGSYQLRAGFYAPEALGPLPDAMFKNGFEN